MIHNEYFMSTLDLKDAYFFVHVHKLHKQFTNRCERLLSSSCGLNGMSASLHLISMPRTKSSVPSLNQLSLGLLVPLVKCKGS
jgi:hypothetical protein